MNNIRFDTENSKCVSAERMMPDELRQLHRLAISAAPKPVWAAGWNIIVLCMGMDVPSSAKHCDCWGGEADACL